MSPRAKKADVFAYDGPVVELHEELVDAAVDDLYTAEWQPRRLRNEAKDRELAESIAQYGVQQYPTVRRRRDRGFDIIHGNRRCELSKVAGKTTVRVRVVTLAGGAEVGDELARDLALIENLHRDDPHPLDECLAFAALRERYGRSVERIAQSINKKASYVLERLVLEALYEPAREALLAHKFSLGTATQIARVKAEKRQAQCVKELTISFEATGPVTEAKARQHVRERYLLRLVDAPFDQTDATLVPAAGPCGPCPHHDGTQRVLYDAVEDKEITCGNSPCWDGKTKAHGKRVLAEAKDNGKTVLSPKESRRLFTENSGDEIRSNEYIAIDQQDYTYTDGKPWKKVLGKERLAKVETFVVVAPSGNPIEVARKKDVLAIVVETPAATDTQAIKHRREAEAQTPAKAKPAVTEGQIVQLADQKARAVMVASIEAGGHTGAEFWRAMTLAALVAIDPGGDSEAFAMICERRGIAIEGDPGAAAELEALVRAMADYSLAQLGGLLAEALSHNGPSYFMKDEIDPLDLLINATGVDVKHCGREAKKELTTAAKAKAKSEKASSRGEVDPSVDEDGGSAADDDTGAW